MNVFREVGAEILELDYGPICRTRSKSSTYHRRDEVNKYFAVPVPV